MDLTEKTTTERLAIMPDRGRLLMSKELEGLVPGLADEGSLEDDVSDPVETAVEVDASPMVILERRVRRGPKFFDEPVIGRLVRLNVGVNELVVGMRLDCGDALVVVTDVRSSDTIYASVQVHRDPEEVVKVPVQARYALISAVIDDVTTAGTCTLIATWGHV